MEIANQNFLKNLSKTLREIGLKKNDNIYLGISLGETFIHYKSEIFKKNGSIDNDLRILCSQKILKTLKLHVGKGGTIIVPTFNFEFYKKKKFNLKKTSSTLGFFEKFFLKQKDIKRTEHPIFSIAAWGREKIKISKAKGLFSFGHNSPFNLFTELNVKFLNLGISFGETCTYAHHLEHLNGINHRYYKPVTGEIVISGKKKIQTYYSLVRYRSIKAKKAEFKIENYLKRNNKIKQTKKFKIYASLISSKDVFELGMKLLSKDPCYFLSKKIVINSND